MVTRAGFITKTQSRLPRFRCRPPGRAPHMFTALSPAPSPEAAPSCPDHPDAKVVYWGNYQGPSGQARRARCLPQDARPHTFLVRPADQLALDLDATPTQRLVIPDAFSLSMVARALSRLAHGSSYRSASAAARAEAGVPATTSWSLAARWCESLGRGVWQRLLPHQWSSTAVILPVGLPGTDAMLVVALDADRGVPLRAELVPPADLARLGSALPGWLRGSPDRVIGCPQALSGFDTRVERIGSTIGWVEWSLACQEPEATRFVSSIMHEERSVSRMVSEVHALLGFVPGRGDETARRFLPQAWDLRSRLLSRGGSFRNIARTNALLGLFVLECHGLAQPETILVALASLLGDASAPMQQAESLMAF